MKKLLLFILLIFSGCEEKYPVYGKFYDSSDQKIDCLCISTSYSWIKQKLDDSLGEYKQKECKYTLKATLHDTTKCNSSFSTATPKDFTGYITLEIYENEKLLYKVQSDFKEDKEASLKRVVTKLREDMFSQ
ncbi:MAG: hypothetical protein JXQ68_04465 [Campylobacterales bacterium]|nr:hypothetical protein [Campylobacterales bacterium]